MVLRKSKSMEETTKAAAKLSDKDTELLNQFNFYAHQNERLKENGRVRQTAKDRGEKLTTFG